MRSQLLNYVLALSVGVSATWTGSAVAEQGKSGELTLIHIGDLHGHLMPRPSVRSDAQGKSEGGVARIYTLVDGIRRAHPGKTLLFNTGDTLHGGAEAMFTQGMAMIDILNTFRFDAYAPGNWDYVYGTDKFIDYFIGPSAKANWNPVIANLYYDSDRGDQASAGDHVAKPYLITSVNSVRVGIIGFTSDRGPTAGDPKVTKGLKFTDGKSEYAKYVKLVREKDVDLVVVLSELGLHGNLTLANEVPGVDVILSSDKHEITDKPVRAKHGTLIVEQGMDGQAVGELGIQIKNGRVTEAKYISHRVDEGIEPNSRIAAMVAEVRKPFVSGPHFNPSKYRNPFNGSRLKRPIDTVIGHTEIALHRSNFSDEAMPAVLEGSSHDFLTDAFRIMTGAQLGGITGFRYGTVISPGPIKMEDLYHFMPIGPQIAKGLLTGAQIKQSLEGKPQNEQARAGEWVNGWTAGYSGLTADFDPDAPVGERVRDIRIHGQALHLEKKYTVAGFYYDLVPDRINLIPAENIEVLKEEDGSPRDATEVVEAYVATLPSRNVTANNLPLDRIRLTKPLPRPAHGIREMQPLGAVEK